MPTSKRFAAFAAAGAAFCVLAACADVPLLPKWNADWTLPLPSTAIRLNSYFPGTVTSGMSANVSFAPQSQTIDATLGQILGSLDTLGAGSVAMTLVKTMALSGSDTLFVDTSATTLTQTAGIVVPITISSTTTQDSVGVPLSAKGLHLLRFAADSNWTLYVQLRGKVTYVGPPASRTVTANDSIGVALRLTASIAVSH